MIVSTIKGRLGNAMFQISAGYALARKLGVPFAINYKLSDWQGQHYKDTVFANIDSTEEEGTPYYEPWFSYSKIPLTDGLRLDGYFQSSKYFAEYKEEIKNLFVLPEVPAPEKGTVGVHIRRGDYLTMTDIHPVSSDEWYRKAIESTGLQNVIACTEPADIPYVEGCGYKVNKGSELEDIVLLSKCDALVMSNSSYSWWAAFLGNHKKVIAPKQWFGPRGVQDFQDIYEKEWIKQ
jgi:hypothetical protein